VGIGINNRHLLTELLTPAACGEGSRSEQFLQLFSRLLGAQYALENDRLKIVTASGDTLVFERRREG
jgi:hypothetical protein